MLAATALLWWAIRGNSGGNRGAAAHCCRLSLISPRRHWRYTSYDVDTANAWTLSSSRLSSGSNSQLSKRSQRTARNNSTESGSVEMSNQTTGTLEFSRRNLLTASETSDDFPILGSPIIDKRQAPNAYVFTASGNSALVFMSHCEQHLTHHATCSERSKMLQEGHGNNSRDTKNGPKIPSILSPFFHRCARSLTFFRLSLFDSKDPRERRKLTLCC